MIARGNSKLGPSIWSWSIPALLTCPGASETCKKLCYANRGHFRQPTTVKAHQRNRRASRSERFVARVLAEIREKRIQTLRIHAAGDFETKAYTEAWMEIARRCRQTTFYGYTRSWNAFRKDGRADHPLRRAVLKLAQEPNVRLYLSTDNSMPRPPKIRGVRTAYLSQNDTDLPHYKVDLVFRNKDETIMKKAGRYAAQVCPVEQGVERKLQLTCSHCKICFT